MHMEVNGNAQHQFNRLCENSKKSKDAERDRKTPQGMRSPTATTKKIAEAFKKHKVMVSDVISDIKLPLPEFGAKLYGTAIPHVHGGQASFLA